MALHGYLFAAKTICSQIQSANLGRGQTVARPQVWAGCNAIIVYANDVPAAQKLFEAWLSLTPEGDNPVQIEIKKIMMVQVIDHLLAETGNVPIDWPKLTEEALKATTSETMDDFEQGYWLDVNTVIRPGPGIDTLRNELPEEINGGLNWSVDKQFYFLISVLTMPPAVVYDPNTNLPVEKEVPETEMAADEGYDFETGLLDVNADPPQLADKAAAMVVRARNAAVAIWLWRKHSARDKLAQNPIRIEPWCGAFGADSR